MNRVLTPRKNARQNSEGPDHQHRGITEPHRAKQHLTDNEYSSTAKRLLPTRPAQVMYSGHGSKTHSTVDGVTQEGRLKSLFVLAKNSVKSARSGGAEARRKFFAEDTLVKADVVVEENGTEEISPIRKIIYPTNNRGGSSSFSVEGGVLRNDRHAAVLREDAEGYVSLKFEKDGSAELGLSLVPESGGLWESEIPTGAKVYALGSVIDERKLLGPGDVLTQVNGQNVGDMPFSRVLNLFDHPPSSDTKPTPTTNRDLKYRRRAEATAHNSPDTTIETASPSTERSSPSYNCLSPVEPRPCPPSPQAVDNKTRVKVPRPADSDRFTSRLNRFSLEGLGHGGAMKTLFTSPRAPPTPGRQTFSSRLATWGGGTPGGKRMPRSRLRTFGRALSFGSPPRFPPPSRSQAPRSPSPCSASVERLSTQPVTVNPTQRMTLRFRTRRKGAEADAEERKEKFWAGTGTHNRRVSDAAFFSADEEAEGGKGEQQQQEGGEGYDYLEEPHPQPCKIRVVGERERGSNGSAFFAGNENEEYEQKHKEEGAVLQPPSPHASEGEVGDGEGIFLSRSRMSVAVLKAEESFRDEGVAAASDAVTAVSGLDVAASLTETELEEDEVVSLSSYLACADRGWPWKGSSVIWAEYVSLSGRHRWVRSEGCRHALLVVTGAMYLLELPADAADRHKTERPSSRAPGGWFLELTAADLKSVTIPLSQAEATPRNMTVDSDENFSPRRKVSSNSRGVFGTAKGEIILHGKSGGSAWLECTTDGSRDALADVVSAWHSAETKSSTTIEVSRVPIEEAVEIVPRGNVGRHMVSLLSDRTTHRTW